MPQAAAAVQQEVSGLEVILQCLAPLRPWLERSDISEIEINSPNAIFCEQDGVKSRVPVSLAEGLLFSAVKRIAFAAGQQVVGDDGNLLSHELHCRFADARVAVLFPPQSVQGITLTLRKFNVAHLSLAELAEREMLSSGLADTLVAAVLACKNILVSGSMGCGKTTLIGALAAFIPEEQRILVIENPAELRIRQPNVVRFEACGGVTQRQLLESALRHGAERLILGECRGEEALAILDSMNVGCQGMLTSLHANSAEQTLPRFLSCILKAEGHPPADAVKEMLGCTVEVIVHLVRKAGKRFVDRACWVRSYDQLEPI